MIRRYKTAEAAEIIGVEEHNMKHLCDYGFLIRTKSGHGYVYDSEQLEEFIRMTRGFDLSNRYAIALAAQIIQPHKKNAVLGRDKHSNLSGLEKPLS